METSRHLLEDIARHPLIARFSTHVSDVSGCGLQLMAPQDDGTHETVALGGDPFEPCDTVVRNRDALAQCWKDCDTAWKGPVKDQIKIFTCHAGLTEILVPIPLEDENLFLTSRGGLCLKGATPDVSHFPGVDQAKFQRSLARVPRLDRKEFELLLELAREIVTLIARHVRVERLVNNLQDPGDGTGDGPEPPDLTNWTWESLEKELYRQALITCNGNKLQASARVGVPKSTFYRRLKELGL